jgi:pimeloyl-ACP methyl ester carboxylesterase
MIASTGSFRHRLIPVGDARLHVVEAGDPHGPPLVLLHGWPESARAWERVMTLAAGDVRAIAVDLPGVGESSGAATDGSKGQIARLIHDLMTELGLSGATLAGHDIGGMVVYAYLRAYQDIARAVILDVPVPGVPPWEDFIRSPFLWHFALHAVPDLPERLVQGRQAEYFGYFYDLLAADPAHVSAEARRAYAAAYATDSALSAGFSWYRAFPADVAASQQAAAAPAATPLLYVRGERERGGDISAYAEGLRGAGVTRVETAVIPGAGHFTPEEAPAEVWRLISGFIGRS